MQGEKKTELIKTRQGGNGDDDEEEDRNKEENYTCIKYQNLSRDISVSQKNRTHQSIEARERSSP